MKCIRKWLSLIHRQVAKRKGNIVILAEYAVNGFFELWRDFNFVFHHFDGQKWLPKCDADYILGESVLVSHCVVPQTSTYATGQHTPKRKPYKNMTTLGARYNNIHIVSVRICASTVYTCKNNSSVVEKFIHEKTKWNLTALPHQSCHHNIIFYIHKKQTKYLQ